MPTTIMTMDQKRRVALVEELCGAFSACQTDDWKQEKAEYLLEKYGIINNDESASRVAYAAPSVGSCPHSR